MLSKKIVDKYVNKFNGQDEENIKQYIDNEQAVFWMEENIPLFECPDQRIEETYYFRWWVYRKHIKSTPEGFIITEFLPPVYWAGRYNSINCAAGHHLYEGRWLRNASNYLEDYIRFWLKGSGNVRSYSTWIADAVYQYCLVKGDFQIALELLPELIENYEQWEKTHKHSSGLFWSIDDRDAMEYSISGNGLRPTLNSYMYADAMAISRISELAGDDKHKEEYSNKAICLKKMIQDKLWDKTDKFFKVYPLMNKELPVYDWSFDNVSPFYNVREEIGFIPWYFCLPDSGYESAWKQLMDRKGFYAPYGPTTAEQRHPRYRYEQIDHECLWNGPSWPFATTQTLTAMANLLKDYEQNYVTKEDFYKIFLAYTYSHYRKKENGMTVNWLDENLDPVTGEWISRKILKEWKWKEDKGGYERGKDYNHSTYCDLIIHQIFGIEPMKNGRLRIRPMIPDLWEWCCLEKVCCQGKEISIMYDKTGDHYQKGKGLQIRLNGEKIYFSQKIESLI